TRLRKTGRLIPQVFYQRDPLSPPFHVNLMLGLRFLQASLLVPLYRRAAVSTRALPLAFEEVSPVKPPKRNASPEQCRQSRQAAKQHNLSQAFVKMMGRLRQQLDQAGGRHKLLVVAGDGSFANRTCFSAQVERTELIARTRKDAVLCYRAQAGLIRFYAVHKFTPEQVRQDETQPWTTTKLFYGGKRRPLRYKPLGPLYWQ